MVKKLYGRMMPTPQNTLNLNFEQRKNLFHGFFLSVLILAPFLMLPFKIIPLQNPMFLFTMSSVFLSYLWNSWFLIPKFLQKKKLVYFLLLCFLSIITISVLRLLLYSLIREDEALEFPLPMLDQLLKIKNFPKESLQMIRNSFNHPQDRVSYITHAVSPALFPMIFAYTLSTSVEVTAQWLKQAQLEKEIENERLNSELLFLRSQINPHFLFNTLNNIYSLAIDKSDHTETSILMLSSMMRYMLYETNAQKVALNKELEYLENYLSLQKLRLSKQKNIKITIEIKGNTSAFAIAPLLLIPLVENAFKHGLSYRQESGIMIYLECEPSKLYFKVQNSKPLERLELEVGDSTGIGLRNIQRRLNLLYPDTHSFNIQENDTYYLVELNLTSI